jgi:hypothetical protein
VELIFDAPNAFNRTTPWIGATLLDTSNPASRLIRATEPLDLSKVLDRG